MPRPSNQELVDEMIRLLTEECPEEVREQTKAWRAEMWRTLKLMRERLCPRPGDG